MTHHDTKPDQLEDVADVLERMKMLETSPIYRRICIDDELVGLWRKMLIEWMYYVIDYCRLQRHAVAAAAFFFDVAIRNKLVETPEEHQLAAATALQLALKTHDSSIIKLEKLVKLGRGLFTEQDVVEMEKRILESTNWRLHPPTADCFIRQYEELLPSTVSKTARSMIEQVTSLVAEVTLADHKYLCYKPSQIGYAAVLMSMELIDHEDFPVVQRQCFLMRMATIANMNSNSKNHYVLKVFDDIKNTLEANPKLEHLIVSLAKQRKQKQKEMLTMRSNLKGKETEHHSTSSPRQVMIRLMSG